MQLQEILYHLECEGDIFYLKELIDNKLVKEVILKSCQRHKCKKKLAEDLVRDYTLRYYRYEDDFTEERYIHEITKYIGRRVRSNQC